jgi:MarR family transcriptional regulator, temperature-dependent positive regulator of motility
MSQERARYRDYVSFRLERVASMVRAEASKIYQERCGLDIRQLRVLRSAAERPGSSVSEIVEATMFERTLVSRLISELASKRLLTRRISQADARQFHIEITRSGLAVVEAADGLGDQLNEDLLSSLDAHERAVLDRCLKKLIDWHPNSADPVVSRAAAIARASTAAGTLMNGNDAASIGVESRTNGRQKRVRR